MTFKDKTVMITGSRRGIGLGLALAFAKEGANVVLNATSDIDQSVLDKFSDYSGQVMTFIGDISNFSLAEEMVKEVKERFGQIDILINNAGITRDGLLMRMSEKDFDDVINVNLKGCFNMTRFVVPVMLKQRFGTIINMTSIVGITGNPGQSNYAASKAGLIGFTKSVAKEVAPRGVTVNAVAPGFIETDMTDALPEKVKEEWLKMIPLKKLGQVQDIAQTCLFLASSSYITGQVIEVNGGLHT
ncbi:3-oxoacyl-[acyl-carrier-protein] reductase [Granulicatella seriolae]|jgi:3-oxoacyl-[acyl-carrier protein] reductase|uniref:3-oxoacyl-[acyl-carrier-protein] reductase n=1 Tax=Granulicatella seriolae TaxID=2967226 RepID=A0ABT1WKH0_9LACT|nr:3-oxoacyl-[acyl-carrier-protein] reductase [Granulicatella seriolae]